MYETMLYLGLILGGVFLLLTIYLFIHNKIIRVIRYFLKKENKKVGTTRVTKEARKASKTNEEKENQPKNDNVATEILEIAQNYATALLDVESTTILPELDANN